MSDKIPNPNMQNQGNTMIAIKIPIAFKRALAEYAARFGYGNITAVVRPMLYSAMLKQPGFVEMWQKHESALESDMADIANQIKKESQNG